MRIRKDRDALRHDAGKPTPFVATPQKNAIFIVDEPRDEI
jgi:hypothetical protein